MVLVTGTPGVGKSSVSRLLASRIDGKLFSLGELVEKEGLYIGRDEKRDTFVVDMEKVTRKINEVISRSVGDIIIEGHYAVDVISPDKVHLVFVLRRDPEELRNIIRERNYKDEKVRENVAAEILDVCLYDAVNRCGASKVCEVDVTNRKVEDVVEEILSILNGKKRCRVGLVDWLGKLESEGRLDEYLMEF